MSDRRKKSAAKNKFIAYTAAIIVHVLIIGAMVINFTSKPEVVEAFDADEIDVVKATTIDESQIKQQQDRIKQKDLDKKRREENDKKRLKELKQQAELEKQRIEDLKAQQKQEQEKALEIEKQRKEIALKREKEKKQAEQEKQTRDKQAAERKKKELEALEKKKKIAQQKKRDEIERKKQQEIADQKKKIEDQARLEKEKEKEKQQQEAQQSFAQQLEAEEARRRSTTLVAKYSALLTQAINAKRTIAPDFGSTLVTKLNIKLSPLGQVRSVSVVESSGNERYDRDAETAVRNASPLPIPSMEEDEAAHKIFQDVTLNISMPDA